MAKASVRRAGGVTRGVRLPNAAIGHNLARLVMADGGADVDCAVEAAALALGCAAYTAAAHGWDPGAGKYVPRGRPGARTARGP